MSNEKQTILLVDDSSTNNILLQAVLEQNGYATEVAFSGKEALKILGKKQHIDAILLDLMMPEMSGYDVLEAVKGNPSTAKIPVMIVSADSEKEDAEKALKMGADFFFEKPLKLNEVVAKVKEMLAWIIPFRTKTDYSL